MAPERQALPPLVIVGAGHAGGILVAKLRAYGFSDPIHLVGSEPHLPYQRPPLSKAWLKDAADINALQLRSQAFYDDNEVALTLEATVTGIDRDAKTVRLADGE